MLKTKQKLMATAVMLVVSMLMATTASFAWFTISTNPEISGLTTSVVTNENLELALAGVTTAGAYDPTTAQYVRTTTDNFAAVTTSNYTYGNLVDMSSYLTASSNALTTVLAPLGINTSGAFVYATYGTNGRVDGFSAATVNSQTGYSSGTSTGAGYGTITDGTTQHAYYVDFWVRTNVAGDLTLTAAVERADGATEVSGSGSTFTTTNGDLANAISVAFSYYDSTATSPTLSTPVAVAKSVSESSGTYTVTFGGTQSGGTLDKIIGSMTANTDYLLRMYVYADGDTITNESASITNGSVTGALNIQFDNASIAADGAMAATLADS